MRTEKERKNLEDKAQYIRRGGSPESFKPADVAALQEFALDIRDIRLYDVLETFWHGRKPAANHQHHLELMDCARPMVCACEVRP